MKTCAELSFLHHVTGLDTPEDRAELEQHLAGCATCRAEYLRFRAVGDALADALEHPSLDSLERVASGEAEPAERHSVEEHARLCQECARTLSVLRGDDETEEALAQAPPLPAALRLAIAERRHGRPADLALAAREEAAREAPGLDVEAVRDRVRQATEEARRRMEEIGRSLRGAETPSCACGHALEVQWRFCPHCGRPRGT